MAAESPAQSDCLTRTQAEQTWPHSHLYWHTERHCWDVTPVGQSHRLADVTPVGRSYRLAYVSAAPAPTRQATTPGNYQIVERDGGMVWIKPPAGVTTYYPALMQEQRPEPEWLTPRPVVDWPLLIDIDTPDRFAPWDRRISGIMK